MTIFGRCNSKALTISFCALPLLVAASEDDVSHTKVAGEETSLRARGEGVNFARRWYSQVRYDGHSFA